MQDDYLSHRNRLVPPTGRHAQTPTKHMLVMFGRFANLWINGPARADYMEGIPPLHLRGIRRKD